MFVGISGSESYIVLVQCMSHTPRPFMCDYKLCRRGGGDYNNLLHIKYYNIYIIKEKLETLSAMESYLPTSDRHAASWIFSDGPSKQLGVVKLRYNALKLFFYNVAILRQRACFRQRLSLATFSQAAKQLRSLSFDVR